MSDQKDLLQSFLKKDAFIKFHADTARMIGGTNNDAILLQFLVDRDNFYKTKDGWFYLTEEVREKETNISPYQQREAIKRLKEKQILQKEKRGIPSTDHFKINYKNYYSQLINYLRTSCKETEGLDNKKLNNYLIDNKEIDSNTKVSKDTKGNSSPVKLKNLFLLEEWRTKDAIPKSQHHLKEGTKVQKKINYLTTLLLNGKFSAVGDFDPKFIADNKLTPERINRKYSEDELLAGVDEMAEMFKLNNIPEDKTKILSMGFDQLIYHPIAKISYLLKYLWNDAKPLEFKTVQVYDHWLEKLYEEGVFERDIEDDHHQFGILKKGLAGIEEYYKWINEQIIDTLTCYSLIDTEDKFFDIYVDWLNETLVHPVGYSIGLNSQAIWYKFIKWLEEAIHGDFVHQYPTLDRRRYESTK